MAELLASITTTILLEALLEPGNEAVWREFDSRYRPLIFGCARRVGLCEEDAAEIAQQTLCEFVRDYRAGKYVRDRGRLRAWVLSIARHRIIDQQRQRARRRDWAGDSVIARLPDDAGLTRIWDVEHERLVFDQALSELREATKTRADTLRAFELLVLQGLPAEEVARQCGLTVAEVYRVKHRITRRLREIVERLECAYADE